MRTRISADNFSLPAKRRLVGFAPSVEIETSYRPGRWGGVWAREVSGQGCEGEENGVPFMVEGGTMPTTSRRWSRQRGYTVSGKPRHHQKIAAKPQDPRQLGGRLLGKRGFSFHPHSELELYPAEELYENGVLVCRNDARSTPAPLVGSSMKDAVQVQVILSPTVPSLAASRGRETLRYWTCRRPQTEGRWKRAFFPSSGS